MKNWTDKDIENQLDMYEENNKNPQGKMIFGREFLKEVFEEVVKIANMNKENK